MILRGGFDSVIAESCDLLGVTLVFNLTIFFINHYYTACWAKILNVPGQLPGKKLNSLTFPCDLVITYLIMKITHQTESLYAVIQIDYFGGIGEQWALVYQGSCLANNYITWVNSALEFLGVKHQDGMDEFDTVGLGNYRAMPEYLEKYVDMADQMGV